MQKFERIKSTLILINPSLSLFSNAKRYVLCRVRDKSFKKVCERERLIVRHGVIASPAFLGRENSWWEKKFRARDILNPVIAELINVPRKPGHSRRSKTAG